VNQQLSLRNVQTGVVRQYHIRSERTLPWPISRCYRGTYLERRTKTIENPSHGGQSLSKKETNPPSCTPVRNRRQPTGSLGCPENIRLQHWSSRHVLRSFTWYS